MVKTKDLPLPCSGKFDNSVFTHGTVGEKVVPATQFGLPEMCNKIARSVATSMLQKAPIGAVYSLTTYEGAALEETAYCLYDAEISAAYVKRRFKKVSHTEWVEEF